MSANQTDVYAGNTGNGTQIDPHASRSDVKQEPNDVVTALQNMNVKLKEVQDNAAQQLQQQSEAIAAISNGNGYSYRRGGSSRGRSYFYRSRGS